MKISLKTDLDLDMGKKRNILKSIHFEPKIGAQLLHDVNLNTSKYGSFCSSNIKNPEVRKIFDNHKHCNSQLEINYKAMAM